MIPIFGGVLFFISLTVHIIIWRIKKPKNDVGALFFILMILPTLLLILFGLGFALAQGRTDLVFFSSLTAVALFYLSLGSAYIQTYPVVQAESPSLEILLAIDQKMPHGLTETDILKLFDNSTLVQKRMQDLINTKLIIEKNNAYHLSNTASHIIRFFHLYRKALGLEFNVG